MYICIGSINNRLAAINAVEGAFGRGKDPRSHYRLAVGYDGGQHSSTGVILNASKEQVRGGSITRVGTMMGVNMPKRTY